MKLTCLILVALTSCAFAEPNDDKIVGGSEATPHAYPFTAAITLEGLCCCGGSILGIFLTLNLCFKLPWLVLTLHIFLR